AGSNLNAWASTAGYSDSHKCAPCHSEIYSTQQKSNHAQTLRRMSELCDLLGILPLDFHDQTNRVDYRIEKSRDSEFPVDLVATKNRHSERLRLLWAFGAGRHGITFVGLSDSAEYGQSLVSWYRE